jgi:ketosteroid isomerase-like protein
VFGADRRGDVDHPLALLALPERRDTGLAMSQENVEVVRRAFAYEIYGVGDRAEAEAIFDPNVVMNVNEGSFHGLDAMRDDFEHWASAFEELEVSAEEFIDAGDRVLVTAYHRGRGRTSGVEVDGRFYEVYTLRDGKVVRVDEYVERADALEAVGLSE